MRYNLKQKLEKDYGVKWMDDSENFNGHKGGVWLSGENGTDGGQIEGLELFDYYAESGLYELGVLKEFQKFLDKIGWFAEWNDAGTMFLWRAQ